MRDLHNGQMPRARRLQDVLYSVYHKEDLKTLAKELGLEKLSKFTSAELAEKSANELLTKTVMQSRLQWKTDREIKIFEKVLEAGGMYTPKNPNESSDLASFAEDEYVFWLADEETVVIPADVEAAYRKWYTPELAGRRRDQMFLTACLWTVQHYYGAIPLDEFYKLVKKGSDIPQRELKERILALPEEFNSCVLIGDLVVDEGAAEDDIYRRIMEAQGEKEYYIPSRKEILELYDEDYPASQEECRKLYEFFLRTFDMDEAQAQDMTQESWQIFNYSHDLRDAMDLINEAELTFDDDKELQEYVNLLTGLNNHTRMLAHRGHMPAEIAAKNMREGKMPGMQESGRQGAGSGAGVRPTILARSSEAAGMLEQIKEELEKQGLTVDLSANAGITTQTVISADGKTVQTQQKKVYPNDPCPCGSGKKYKYCCGAQK